MFCPKCGGEFSWDVMICPKCDVETVDRLPGPDPTPDAKLVRVLVTGDAGLIAFAQSLLEGENIEFLVRGDGLQDLFALGRLTAYNFAMGPVEIWVGEADADRARGVLEGVGEADEDQEPPRPA